MIQSGHWKKGETLKKERFSGLIEKAIEKLNVNQARKEVEPFVRTPEALEVWSKEFFRDIVTRIVLL